MFAKHLSTGLVAGALISVLLVMTPGLEPVRAATASEGAAARCQGRAATIVGTAGDDVLQGTPRADVIVGLGGRDSLFGNGGNDIICAGDNPETVDSDGYPIPEYVNGGPGDDHLVGGPGRDEVISGRGNDVLDGGAGPDALIGVNVDRDRNHGGFDRMFGGPEDDSLYAWTSRVEMHGGPGDDRLEGDDAADRLFGDAGDDTLVPDAGDDRVAGGSGLDVVDYTQIVSVGGWGSHTSAVMVNLSEGVARGKRFGLDRLRSDVEGAYTGDGNDTLIGNAGRNFFYGGYGDRTVVDGRGGRDLLTFNSEDIAGGCCDAVTVDLATGTGHTSSPYGGRTRLTVRGIEDVQGSGDGDVLLGDAGPNRLIGGTFNHHDFGDGDDLLDGRGGNDTLIGSGDDDDLRGSGGDDILFGDFGDDHLDGGPGVNQLDGGAGADVCLNPSSGTACE